MRQSRSQYPLLWTGTQARRLHGATLVELAVVLAIVVTLATLALPPLAELTHQRRADAAVSDLRADLTLARTTAIMLGRSVTVCGRTSTNQCTSDLDWSQGWLLRAEQPRPDEADPAPPLAARQLQSHSSLQAFSTHGRPHIVFRASGRSAGSNARIRVCQRGLTQAEVVVSNTGRVRSLRSASPEPC